MVSEKAMSFEVLVMSWWISNANILLRRRYLIAEQDTPIFLLLQNFYPFFKYYKKVKNSRKYVLIRLTSTIGGQVNAKRLLR